MHNPQQTNHNELTEDVKRFEKMENGQTEYYFDVHSIENIFDFYAENEQFEKAERVLQLGIKIHPGAVSLLLKQAVILLEKGNDKEAISILNGLAELEQSNPDILFNLGWAYLKIEDIGTAVSYFKKTLEAADDEYEDFLLDIALFLNQSEEYTHTIDFLEQGREKCHDNENLLFELAYAYDKEGNVKEGINIYERLLDVNPFSENAWYNLGILYIRNEDYVNAIKCYDYALAIDPSHAEALFNKANALVNLGELRNALDCYFDYVSFGYDIVLAYHYIADCLEQMGFYELALRFFRTITKIDPSYMPAWLGYIALLINRNQIKEALSASAKALLTSGSFPEFMYLRANALLLADKPESALKWFGKSIINDLDNVRNIFEWLQVKKQLNPMENVFSYLDEWLHKYPDSTAVNYAAAAIAIQESGDTKLAARFLETALQKAPENFDYFLDVFSISEDIFQDDILNHIITKYTNHEF